MACLGGGLRVLEHPLAQAFSYIIEASGSGPAISKRDTFSRSIMHGMAWHFEILCWRGNLPLFMR